MSINTNDEMQDFVPIKRISNTSEGGGKSTFTKEICLMFFKSESPQLVLPLRKADTSESVEISLRLSNAFICGLCIANPREGIPHVHISPRNVHSLEQ